MLQNERPPLFNPTKIPGTYFCYKLCQPQGHSAVGNMRYIEKSDDLIRNWTPTTYAYTKQVKTSGGPTELCSASGSKPWTTDSSVLWDERHIIRTGGAELPTFVASHLI
jgi:hypothetical protein